MRTRLELQMTGVERAKSELPRREPHTSVRSARPRPAPPAASRSRAGLVGRGPARHLDRLAVWGVRVRAASSQRPIFDSVAERCRASARCPLASQVIRDSRIAHYTANLGTWDA